MNRTPEQVALFGQLPVLGFRVSFLRIDKPFQSKKRASQAPRHVQSTVHEL